MAQPPRRDRLDQILLARSLAPSRSRAQALILAGRVSSAGVRLEKPGVRYPLDIALEVRQSRRFVSRAGHKLQGAFERFDLPEPCGGALDVGASTGGFTQFLLESGYEPVIALDVGRGQLDWSLRSDARVVVIEGKNARFLSPADLPFCPRLAVIDVSFISLERVLPAVAACLEAEGDIVALIKPQFEAGRHDVGSGGIVRDPATHRRVVEGFAAFAAASRCGVAGVCASPLRGADGNREFFMHLRPGTGGLDPGDLAAAIEVALGATTESQP